LDTLFVHPIGVLLEWSSQQPGEFAASGGTVHP